MNALYIDSNIYLNLFFREVNPKTGLELWRGSKVIFDHILDKDSFQNPIIFFMSLFNC